ncbi:MULTISPECIES: hypothetical protein [Rhizobium]|uniref:Uncharacterized protein n=2 Tax=Rhizobium TaxID=379 RepID=A0AAF1KKM7_9HYPH|nr:MULTISPECIES: hypothetical protein [Rhizobium]MBO9097570.1 hypothetical protein [Rhizobium sp. L58/93]MBO9133025.1 hypothetical protein [Rhizobium sp. B209b/85]MBO9168436.1 hypothetical protein [Rhizobium sp. L245/93]MBO9183769.1 hypothetical protein [Rhizobium sp. E27B/91]MBZ5759924.1 hypothetical protein [Rhizobium sp. VS19-DR96]
MANETSKSREEAEIAFAGTQTHFYARGQAAEELDAMVADRESKTARLREARLAKDRRDMIAATAARLQKRSAKA